MKKAAKEVGKKIIVGVCVMEKKVKCSFEVLFSVLVAIAQHAPVQLSFQLQWSRFLKGKCFGEFEVVYFGDKAILEDPIESGYPLKKAETYASLRRPFLVNELEPQYLLHDRTKVYECWARADTSYAPLVRIGKIQFDHKLATAMVERWRQETHTFHLPFGKVTITLQDVEVLFGLCTDGDAVVYADEMDRNLDWCTMLRDFTGLEVESAAINVCVLWVSGGHVNTKEIYPNELYSQAAIYIGTLI
ncbi:hypothetical protein FXO38_24711 [Capsicum annuum]|nr:hypothetical protein FXO38_24711 [Capsicum annuum]